mgnify:CR=1 FL=1
MPRLRAMPALLFVIAVSALVGGIFGRDALATDDRVLEYQKTFSAALGAIESNYVETVDADRLVYGAIRGMLATLDPHSSFYDPKEYSAMRERQEGRYYGLGITIQSINGDITASSVFDLLQNTLDSGERELQLVQSQATIAEPRLQFDVSRLH